MHEDNTAAGIDDTIADADLILRTRSGDTGAFGELWRRHYPAGVTVARSVTSSIDADDLVQEAYTRIYQAIVKGGGPNGSFRAYLFTSIRNTAAAWGRSRREDAMDELDTVAHPDSTDQASNEALDRSLTAQAFRSLPTRWQEVLWYTEIEQMRPNEVAPLLGMKAGAVSQLAFRAREGLREAWIQAHLRSAAPGSECQWTIEHLGAYSRGNLGTRDHRRIEAHLDECARCMIVAAEAKDVSKRLALVLLPLVLGVTGASGYLAALQGGATPIAALAAMPSSIANGVVVGDGGSGSAGAAATGSAGSAGGAGATGAGNGAGAGGASGAGGAGGSAGASGGILSGMGALVGAGSAALVVAGVVAAATILPGLGAGDAATSLPSAGDSDSSISSNVEPDDAMNADADADEIDKTDETEKDADEVEVAPEETPDEDAEQSGPESAIEAPDIAPVGAAPAAPGSATPTVPTTPGDGEGDPGTEEPGTGEPGTEEPGTGEPGTGEPGTGEPGTGEPGTGEPGVPQGTPRIVSVSGCTYPGDVLDITLTRYTVQMQGVAGATVTAYIGGFLDFTMGDLLDAQGLGTVELLPQHWQLVSNLPITFSYTVDGQPVKDTFSEPVVLSALPVQMLGECDPGTVDAAGETTTPAEQAPVETPVDPAVDPSPVARLDGDDEAADVEAQQATQTTAPVTTSEPLVPATAPVDETVPADAPAGETVPAE